MACLNCGHWAFTARGRTEEGNEKSTCNECGEVHVEKKKHKIQHGSINPNHYTVIKSGQKWKLVEDETMWKVDTIFVEPELKVRLSRVEEPENTEEDWSRLVEPIKLLDRSTWNYAG
jgi:hypothetical protein